MKKIFLFLFVILCINCSNAQTTERDSLRQLLRKEKTDTGRVFILTDLSLLYRESMPDTSMLLALEASTISKRIGFLKGEATSLIMMGGAFSVLGNYPKSMECNLLALKINQKVNNIDGIARNFK